MIPRVVYDCMVFLQAANNGAGASGECLRLAEYWVVELYLNPEITAEIVDVLSRPRTRKNFPALTPEVVRRVLRRISQFATIVAGTPKVAPSIRDPKDEKYLNLAIAANAQYLVTRDNDLLDLMKDESFRTAYPNLEILEPAAFLQLLAPR